MKAHIIYSKYLDESKTRVTIGGVQTYITNLISVFRELGINVSLYQCAEENYSINWNDIKVYGVNYQSDKGPKIGEKLFKCCKQYADPQNDLIVFATDTLNVKCDGYKTIAIQHGIFWDIPKREYSSKVKYFLEYVNKARQAWNTISRCSKVDSLVCVDYNFINWYRALVPFPKVNLYAIPNFTAIPEKVDKTGEKTTVIFARRFFEYRGTRVFADAMAEILKNFNINVIVAGEGPDEPYLREKLSGYPQVKFIRYNSDESLMIHEKCDIAVVPTIGSEGTSLSLLEAMASKCAVVCTNVGGMTNIVLDHYNGLIIPPSSSHLYEAIKELIEDKESREQIAGHALETAKTSFNLEKWKRDWMKILEVYM